MTETQYTTFGQSGLTVQYAQRISTAGLTGGLIDSTLTGRLSPLQTDTNNRITQFTYDTRGQLKTTTDARNFVTQYTYSSFGEMLTRTLDTGTTPGSSSRVDFYSYDTRGFFLVHEYKDTSYLGIVLEYGRDAFGRLVSTRMGIIAGER